MSVRLRMISGLVVSVAVVCAAFAGSFVAQRAFATSTEGVIYACVGERSGALRVVDGPDDCLRGEEPLSWDSQPESGITGYERLETDSETVSPGGLEIGHLDCSPGKVVLSGGVDVISPSPLRENLRIVTSAPISDESWSIFVTNIGSQSVSVIYFIVCADGTGAPPVELPDVT